MTNDTGKAADTTPGQHHAYALHRDTTGRRVFLQRGAAVVAALAAAPTPFQSAASAQADQTAPSASTGEPTDGHDLRVTSLGHSGIRIEHNGTVMVIDPGILSAPDAAMGADALLITHEHPDHFDAGRIAAAVAARPGLPVWPNASGAALLDGSGADVHVIGDGDAFDVNGIAVQAYGEWHAPLHPELPVVRNTGFLIGSRIFHPGDALTDPGVPIKLLLVPVQEFFARADALVDYIRQVKPAQVSPVHDATLNDLGHLAIDHFLAQNAKPGAFAGTGVPYSRLLAQTPASF
jgi:L-ascorbate metabolism protein UlaG (beta-lactamase superfamily)